MKAPSFAVTAADYRRRWEEMIVPGAVKREADAVAKRTLENIEQYREVEAKTGVPWFWLGPIHYREADLNFHTHLANGDPLTHRTYHVPKGLIVGVNPPYTWSQAAVAALEHEGLEHVTGWDEFARYAYEMERYNGWGYRGHRVTSPYLWSQSNQHLRGKYVRDGVYSPSAVDEQLGGLVILKSLMDLDGAPKIEFADLKATPAPVAAPKAVDVAAPSLGDRVMSFVHRFI